MPEGPFGLPRPFVEERESPVYILVEFDKEATDREQVRRDAQAATRKFSEIDVVFSNVEVTDILMPSPGFLISIQLGRTSIDINTIEDIQKEFLRRDGYRNLTVSTVSEKELERFR